MTKKTTKQFRVQDLANYNRVVTFPDGDEIKFDGHFANVPEKHISFFASSGDFQIMGEGFEVPSAKFVKDEPKEEVKEPVQAPEEEKVEETVEEPKEVVEAKAETAEEPTAEAESKEVEETSKEETAKAEEPKEEKETK